MHLSFSQSTKITQAQKEKIENIFTADYIIEISAIISNEKHQIEIIKSLEKKIDSLKTLSKSKDILISKYAKDVIQLNEVIRDVQQKEDVVSDNQLKASKKPFLGLHLKLRSESENFDLKRINFSVNLSYDLKDFSIGIKGAVNQIPDINNNVYKSEFYYGPFIEYKIF